MKLERLLKMTPTIRLHNDIGLDGHVKILSAKVTFGPESAITFIVQCGHDTQEFKSVEEALEVYNLI